MSPGPLVDGQQSGYLDGMKKKVSLVAVVSASLLLAAPAAAQSWGVTALAPQDGPMLASVVFPNFTNVSDTATVPVGPIAPGVIAQVLATGQGYTAQGLLAWAESVPGQTAPVAFSISSTLGKQFPAQLPPGDFTIGGAGVAVTVEFTLTAPTPVDGAVQISLVGGVPGLAGQDITVDVGGDGTVDWTYDQSLDDLMVPLSIPSNGAVVRVGYQVSVYGAGSGTLTRSHDLQVQFFPGTTVCEPYDFTGAGVPLDVEPLGGDVYDLILQPVGTTTPLLVAFGYQDYVVPLWPGVTLLVGLDVLLPVGPGGVVQLALPPLPPGYELFAQGLSIDGGGGLLSSNSVRAAVL